MAENDDHEPQPEAEPQPEQQPEPAQEEAEPEPEPDPEPPASVQDEPQQQQDAPESVQPRDEPESEQPQGDPQPETGHPHAESAHPQPAAPQPAYPQSATPQPAYPHPQPQQPPQSQPYPPAPGGFPGGPGPGYAAYPPPAPPARVKGAPLIRLGELIPAAVDAVVPLAAGLLAVVLGLLLVVGVGLSGVSVQSAGAGDYFAGASWLTASSLGTPFGGGMSDSVAGLGSASFSSSSGVTLRAAVWLVTVLILFLAFHAARRRERRAHRGRFAQLVVRSLLPALLTSILLLILALTTQRTSVFGLGGLFGGGNDVDAGSGLSVTQNGSFGIDTPLVFVGPLLLVLVVALIARISVWIQAPESRDDPLAQRVRTQWDLWRPSLRVAWLQLRIIVTLSSLAAWFYIAVQAGTDSNSSDHPLVYVLGALVLILNLGIYGMFAGFGVTLYATAATLGGSLGGGGLGSGDGSGSSSGSGGLSGSGFAPYSGSSAGSAYSSNLTISADSGSGSGGSGSAFGILSGSKPWEIWILLAIAVVGTLTPAVLAWTKRPRKRPLLAADYAPAAAWRAVLLGVATALALILLGTLELDESISSSGGFGDLGTTVGFGPSLFAGMGLTALWFLLAYLAVSFALGHRVHWRTPAGVDGPTAATPAGYAGQPYPQQQQYQQQYGQPYGQPYQQPYGQPPSAQQYAQPYQQQYGQPYQQPYPGPAGPADPAAGPQQAPFAPGVEQSPLLAPLPPPPAPAPVPVETVAPDDAAGSVEPMDPSETAGHVVFPDEEDTLGEG